jgi:hypothetical protein
MQPVAAKNESAQTYSFWSLSWGSTVRDIVTTLSFANLSFLRPWEQTLAYRRREVYLMRDIPRAEDFLAPAVGALLLAVVLFTIVRICRHYASLRFFYLIRYFSFALVLLPLNGLRAVLAGQTKYLKSPLLELIGPTTFWLVIVPLLLVALWIAWTWQQLIVRIVVVALVSLFPFCLFTFGQSLMAAARATRPASLDYKPATPAANPNRSARVVWVIFDEWDYRLTFRERPAGLKMPAVDRFAAESLSASSVRSPAMDTGTSVPSLLTGERIRISPGPGGASLLAEEVEGVERMPWTEAPNIFSAARAAGYNTAAIGWYLPYCRMFNILNDCAWWPMPTQATSKGYGLWAKVYGETRSLFETDSLSLFGRSLAVKQKTAIQLAFQSRSEAAASNPQLGFVFLHAPAPHAPHSYSRETGRFDLKNNPLRGYIDSLALLDATLASLRERMEEAGLWDTTAVLLSSDHPFREATAIDGKMDPRVPFLLKMPGQKAGLTFSPAFNSIISANLVMSILHGKTTTPAEAAAWLQAHRRDQDPAAPGASPR